MKQVYQDPSSGKIEVADLPPPALRPGTLLVRNHFSIISPGTERSAVRLGRDSLLATARARPDLVRRVVDTARREGVLVAYRRVRARLGDLKALGYASAGFVVAVGPGAGDHFRVGDRVACAGSGQACHAELVCVPVNLAAKVSEGVSLDAAAFATLGAIALHGVHQARATLGERFAVVGLGVLGLLTVQLLRAAGVRVVAFDLSGDLVRRAAELGAERAEAGGTGRQVTAALEWTEGVGVDGVIVTAASASDAPMVAAAGMCRQRGRITAVGLVPFGLPRHIAYEKEIELTIARSYGPGRYDHDFEEKGLDYPIEYVRWTETRNLEAFLHLVAERRADPLPLVTHRVTVDDAPRAYAALLEDGPGRPLGMVIEYPRPASDTAAAPGAGAGPGVAGDGGALPQPVRPALPIRAARPRPDGAVAVGCIGAGAFARGTLLPILRRERGVRLRAVVTAHGLSALQAQRQFGFEMIGTDPEMIFSDPGIHVVVIATRHDTHADLAVRALLAGKHVFVEKPLALHEGDLRRVEEALAVSDGTLMVGFNRRFAPHAVALKRAFEGRAPLMIDCRVNAGVLPPGHWLDDPVIGGGRLAGEACHFVDLLSFLAEDAAVTSLQATAAGLTPRSRSDFSAALFFANGSVAHLMYTTLGSPRLGKERIEVHGGGQTGVIEDFGSGIIHTPGRSLRLRGSGKGHAQQWEAFLGGLRAGVRTVGTEAFLRTTRTTLELATILSG